MENQGSIEMKNPVFFIPVYVSDHIEDIVLKFQKLIEKSRILDVVRKDTTVAVKMHFGEEGNTGYVRPEYVRLLADELIQRGAMPVLSDTNTLYRGRRTNSVDHQQIAYEHGFTEDAVHAQVFIPDDMQPAQVYTVQLNGPYIKQAKIARFFHESDTLVAVTHFKGHIMTGFGGSLKNVGMGCATREGKLAQHSDIAPFVIKQKCVGCGSCLKVCPVKAIDVFPSPECHGLRPWMNNGEERRPTGSTHGAPGSRKAFIDTRKCIGCASCIAACANYNAIEVDWGSGRDTLQERMIEYAQAVLGHKKGRCAFFNFCIKITKECDCLAKDDPRIVEDVGILASVDPVAVDKASFDLVIQKAGKDIFAQVHPDVRGAKHLQYAAARGLGNLEYELQEI